MRSKVVAFGRRKVPAGPAQEADAADTNRFAGAGPRKLVDGPDTAKDSEIDSP